MSDEEIESWTHCRGCGEFLDKPDDDDVNGWCAYHRNILGNPPPEESTLSTKSLNKYVVSIHGDQVTFTDKIWVAIKKLIQERERLARIDELEQQHSWTIDFNDDVAFNLEKRIEDLSKQAVKVKGVTK